MSRKLPGSAIVPGSITLTQITGSLNDTTNAAYAQANTARNTANDAYGQANTARSDANTTFATINTTFGTVNTNYQAAYAQANTARGTANDAYAAANTKLSTSGGSISGDLAITGNLTVQGNATTINVTNLSVNDSMILLSTNAVGDSNDIGFIGHFDRDATATHAGLIRKATENRFYLFDNYEVEPTNNVIDVAGNNFRVGNLRLGIINANSYVTSAGLDVTGQANAAYGAANNRVLKAGDTMTGNLTLSSASPMIRLQESGSGGDKRLDLRVNSGGVAFISADQSSQELALTTTGTERIRITSGGNVGIGTATPGYILSTSSSVHGQYSQHRQSSGVGVGQEMYYMFNDSSGAAVNYASIYTEIAANTAGSHTGKIALRTVTSGTLSTKLLVDQTGNVAIGTSSPLSLLYLQASAPDLIVNGTDAASTYGVKIRYNGSTTHGLHLTYYPNSAVSYIDNTYQVSSGTPYGDIYFRHNVAGTMTTRMTLKADGGYIGISTTTPYTYLHVNGAYASPQALIGSSGNNGIFFHAQGGATHTNWVFGQQRTISGFEITPSTAAGGTTFSTPAFVILSSNQNVGVGTATPGRRFHAYINGSDIARFEGSSYFIDIDGNGNQITGSNALAFRGTTGGSPHLYITSGGIVGIGTTTPTNCKLAIQGDWVSGQATVKLYPITSFASGGLAGYGIFDSDGTTRKAYFVATSSDTQVWNGANTAMVFGTNDVERIRITNTGNLGIGTTNPSGLWSGDERVLHLFSSGGTAAGLRISSVNASAEFFSSAGTVEWGLYSGTSSPFTIYTSGSHRLRIDASGNMYLGLTGNPSGWGSAIKYAIRQSSASGYTGFVSFASGNDHAIAVGHDGTVGMVAVSYATGSYTPLVFHVGGSERIRIDTAGNVGIGTTNPGSYKLYVQGDQYVSGTLTEASSIALKENIDPISNALDTISKLVGVTYDRKDGSAKNRAGLIAEEVEQVLPNVVNKDEEGNPTGIQYTNLIAYLVESIKELKAEIDVLKSK